MPDLIDKAQLQATAQVAKSYILDQDTANVNTIINALQSSQPAAKTTPTLTLGGWSASDTVYSAAITYNGDGTLSTTTGTISGGTLTVNDQDGSFSGTISASEGTNYAASSLNFNHAKETVQGGGGNTKQEGVLLLKIGSNDWSADTIGYIDMGQNQNVQYSYNGDGTVKWAQELNPYVSKGSATINTANHTIDFTGSGHGNYVIFAPATNNYTAAVATVYFSMD